MLMTTVDTQTVTLERWTVSTKVDLVPVSLNKIQGLCNDL